MSYHFWDYVMGARGHAVLQNSILKREAHIPGLVKTTFSSESSGGRWQEESAEKVTRVDDTNPSNVPLSSKPNSLAMA